MGELENKILDAMELIASEIVQKAGYDKTIQAKILSCEDPTIGKYKCKYQNSTFYAYSENIDTTYSPNSMVYITIPNNDNKQNKLIKGTVNRLGTNYVSTAPQEQLYDMIGTNCLIDNQTYYLNTNNKDYSYKIYSSNNDNNITVKNFENYIKQSSSLLIGANIKTSIQAENQYRGHYGIAFTLSFRSNTASASNDSEVLRTYILNEDNMVGNPYRLVSKTRQYEIFDIDGTNFLRIESIQIFNKDFPNATEEITGERLQSGDIEISNLQLMGAIPMKESEINGIAISFYTPQGTFFTDSSNQKDYKTITAQIKVKGRIATSLERVPFYWGVNNITISTTSQQYNKFLGKGWQCLNDYNIITDSENNESVVEWVPGKDTYIVNLTQAVAKNNFFKVAVIYDDTVVTKEINIQNLNSNYDITIVSNAGTQFYYDSGHPTLTCLVNGKDAQEQQDTYLYYWGYESNTGVFENLSEDFLQQQYQRDLIIYKKLLKDILEGTALQNTTAFNENNQELNQSQWENYIKSYDYIQRIYKNKIYDVQINRITSFGTFKCSVFSQNHQYLGTASITLTNTLESEGTYSLVINNGTTVYQYDEQGNAPTTVQGSLSPQQIKALSFTLYNNLGQPIDSIDILKDEQSSVRWAIPLEDSLLIDNTSINQDENDENWFTDLKYNYYDNRQSLAYKISSKYVNNRTNNQILLTVNYKGMILTAKTNFTFIKQGDPGTNGTDYIVKIIPNTKMQNPPLIPIVTKTSEGKFILNYGLNTDKESSDNVALNSGVQLFKAQLWNNGEKVTDSFTIVWEMLFNPDVKDISKTDYQSSFEIVNGNRFKYNPNIKEPFNIVKCTIFYEGKQYFSTLPIITVQLNLDNYKLKLKENTGFNFVLYTTDGVNPQYDKTNPFEFECYQTVDNEEINVSTTSVEGYEIIYDKHIKILPERPEKEEELTPQEKQLPLMRLQNNQNLYKNQFNFIPSKTYDGYWSNIAILWECYQGQNYIGKVHIPIHFLLNKYGLANLNDWDGNSIKIDDAGGYILSPQMGAGSKDNNNKFTGVLMGEVKQANKTINEIGLFGYSQGDRTFFLDSQTGGALFGKNNSGRIIVNPTASRAIIVSNNYWNSDNYNEKGFPQNLDRPSDGEFITEGGRQKRVGAGMLIDLSTPQIKFGNGHFSVDNKKGIIAGWEINKEELIGDQLHLKKTGQMYSGNHISISTPVNGFYLSHEGLSIGSKVKITSDGVAYFGQGAVDGGNGNHWTINGDSSKSYISYGGNTAWTAASNDSNSQAKVYIGTDGISLGSKFSVSPLGALKAKSGQIGGWTINLGNLSSTNGNYRIELSGGTLQGGEYKNDQFTDNGWKISRNGSVTFTSGTIGGWKIGSDRLTGGNMTIKSDGSLSGSNWSISSSGVATFSKLNGSVAPGFTLTGAGFSLGGSGGGSSIGSGASIGNGAFLSPGGVSVPGGISLNQHIKNLAVDQIEAKVAKIDEAYIRGALNSRGTDAYWGSVVKSVGITVTRTSDGKIKDISQNTKYIMALVGGYEW